MKICDIYTYAVCVYEDFTVGPEGACVLPGLLWAEEGLKTQEPGDHNGAEEGGVPQTGEPAQESKIHHIEKSPVSTNPERDNS